MRADLVKTHTFWFRFSKILLILLAVIAAIFTGQLQLSTTSILANDSGSFGFEDGTSSSNSETFRTISKAVVSDNCPTRDIIRVEEDCYQGSWCKFNIWQSFNSSTGQCDTGRGGVYGCQAVVGRCGYQQPAQVIQPQLPVCPTPGQSGSVQQSSCNNQYSYDDFRIIDRWPDGSPKQIYSEYTQNRHCQGTILCAQLAQVQPAAPVNNQCTSSTTNTNRCLGTQLCRYNVTNNTNNVCGNTSENGPFDCRSVEGSCGYNTGSTCSRQTSVEDSCVGTQRCSFNLNRDSSCNVTRSAKYNCRESNQCRTGGIGAAAVTVLQNNPQTQTNNQTVNVTLPRAAAANPVVLASGKVSGVSVKELPKTGLPMLAWAVTAFLPLGLKFKRFGRDAKYDANISANYLWEEKRFKQGVI